MKIDLRRKVDLIIGSGTGIGAATTRLLATNVAGVATVEGTGNSPREVGCTSGNLPFRSI